MASHGMAHTPDEIYAPRPRTPYRSTEPGEKDYFLLRRDSSTSSLLALRDNAASSSVETTSNAGGPGLAFPSVHTFPRARHFKLQQFDTSSGAPMGSRGPSPANSINGDSSTVNRKASKNPTPQGSPSPTLGGAGRKGMGHWRDPSATPASIAMMEKRRLIRRPGTMMIELPRRTLGIVLAFVACLLLTGVIMARTHRDGFELRKALQEDARFRAEVAKATEEPKKSYLGVASMPIPRPAPPRRPPSKQPQQHQEEDETKDAGGDPLGGFRNKLDPSKKYLTSLAAEGSFTAQTKTLYRLASLASAVDRAVILPPMSLREGPKHREVFEPVSRVFNVSHIRSLAHLSAATEWEDLHPAALARGKVLDDVGCWANKDTIRLPPKPSAKDSKMFAAQMIHRARSLAEYGVSVSMFPLTFAHHSIIGAKPQSSKDTADFQQKMREFDRDTGAKSAIVAQAFHANTAVGPPNSVPFAPEEKAMCIDSSLLEMPYRALDENSQLPFESDEAWELAGKHFIFSRKLEAEADKVGSQLLHGVPKGFIGVHIDKKLVSHCKDRSGKKCTPSVASFARAVSRVQGELSLHSLMRGAGAGGKKGASREQENVHEGVEPVRKVLVTTDVEDPAFRIELQRLGWAVVDWNDVVAQESYSRWSIEVIEAVLMGRSAGFVGTRGSETSELAARRVRSWREGPIALV